MRRASPARRLAPRLVAAVTLAALGGALLAGITVERLARRLNREELARQLVALSAAMSAALPAVRVAAAADEEAGGAARERLSLQLSALAGTETIHEAFVLDPAGRILASTGDAGVRAALVRVDRDVLAQAAASGTPSAAPLYEDAAGVPYQVAYAPIRDANGVVLGFTGVEASSSWFAASARVNAILAAVAALSALLAAAGGALLARPLVARLRAVAQGARQMGAGRFGVRIGAAGSDELGEVAAALDSLGEAVQQREETIRALLSAALEGTIRGGPEGVASGVLQVDDEGTIRAAGAGAQRLLCKPEAELVGKPVGPVLEAAGAALLIARERLRSPAGEPAGEAVFLHDRSVLETARRADEERRRLVAAGELAALVAHEIRTPLNALSLELGLLARDLAEGSPAAGPVARGRAEIDSLERTVREFLELARPITPSASRILVAELFAAAEVHAAHELAQAGAGVRIEGGGELSLKADLELSARALGNLLRNAAAAKPGGTIRLTAAPSGSNEVRIEVADEGPGIPAAAQERLFQPFSSGRASGAGLGLSLARRIARAHGGGCELVGTGPGGTCFALTLPEGSA